MFGHFRKLKSHHQVIFSIIIGLAVVFFWRGAWGIMDVYIFPGHYELSSWVSLKLGIFILASTHYLTKKLA